MLASIQKIKEIAPIKDADKIVVATVLGYKSVVKIGEFKENDLCVFIFPDTIVQRASWNKFLWPKGDEDISGPPIRIKCCKLRKQISEGLTLPISILGEGDWKEGDIVEEQLKVSKYTKDIPVSLAGDVAGHFPGFLRKTDSERIQNYPELLEEFKVLGCVGRIKFDGTSATFYFKDGKFGVCSRNWELKESDGNVYWEMERQYHLRQKLTESNRNIAIQGEIIGPGIQGNKMGLAGRSLIVFDVWDIDKQKYYDSDVLEAFCQENGIQIATEVYRGDFALSMEELQEFANKQTYSNQTPSEGIVFRPNMERMSEKTNIGRMAFKVISQTFAIKYGE